MFSNPKPSAPLPEQVERLHPWPDLSTLDPLLGRVAHAVIERGLSRSVAEFVEQCRGFHWVGTAGVMTACEIGPSDDFSNAVLVYRADPEGGAVREAFMSAASYARFLLDLVDRFPDADRPPAQQMRDLRLTALG